MGQSTLQQNLKNEIVFQIAGEGGSICINRQKTKLGEKFIYHHSEFDPSEEGLDVNIKADYDNFEQPFQLINKKYPWYSLFILTAHADFWNYIIENLIEKLNEESIPPEYLNRNKDELEDSLKIKLNYCSNEHNDTPLWSCEKLKDHGQNLE